MYQLTGRFGGFLIFHIAVPPAQEAAAAAFVARAFPTARATYALAGSLKFDLPVSDVKLADVFKAMEGGRRELAVLDWSIANMTLEEVSLRPCFLACPDGLSIAIVAFLL